MRFVVGHPWLEQVPLLESNRKTRSMLSYSHFLCPFCILCPLSCWLNTVWQIPSSAASTLALLPVIWLLYGATCAQVRIRPAPPESMDSEHTHPQPPRHPQPPGHPTPDGSAHAGSR